MKKCHLDNTVFCIPTYKRSDRQDTLQYLKSVGIEQNEVYLFVQTEEDYRLYKRYGDLCTLVYKSADNLPKARNNILDYFGGTKNIVMMDDDVSVIAEGSKGRKFRNIEDRETLCRVISDAYELTSSFCGAIWGFYPVPNEFFMTDTVDTQKPVNTILGFPKGFDARFDERFIAKEDIELCGRLLFSGQKIIRFNNLSFKAKHRTNKGGANEVWKSGKNAYYSSLLEIMYPGVYRVQRNNPEEIRTITRNGRVAFREWEI